MSNGKEIMKKRSLRTVFMLNAMFVASVGVLMIVIYLFYEVLVYNNVFVGFLGIWLGVLGLDLAVINLLYLEKNAPRSPITAMRHFIIKKVQYAKTMAYIFTAIGVFIGSFVLTMYRAATSGLIKVPAPITSQEVVPTLLLLISLPLLAYAIKREARKVIQLETENVTVA